MALSDPLSAKVALLSFGAERDRVDMMAHEYAEAASMRRAAVELNAMADELTMSSKVLDLRAGELSAYIAPLAGEDADEVGAYLLDGKDASYHELLDDMIGNGGRGGMEDDGYGMEVR